MEAFGPCQDAITFEGHQVPFAARGTRHQIASTKTKHPEHHEYSRHEKEKSIKEEKKNGKWKMEKR